MTAWLSRAGAAPLALGPVLPGWVFTPERPQCDGTAAGKSGRARALKA